MTTRWRPWLGSGIVLLVCLTVGPVGSTDEGSDVTPSPAWDWAFRWNDYGLKEIPCSAEPCPFPSPYPPDAPLWMSPEDWEDHIRGMAAFDLSFGPVLDADNPVRVFVPEAFAGTVEVWWHRTGEAGWRVGETFRVQDRVLLAPPPAGMEGEATYQVVVRTRNGVRWAVGPARTVWIQGANPSGGISLPVPPNSQSLLSPAFLTPQSLPEFLFVPARPVGGYARGQEESEEHLLMWASGPSGTSQSSCTRQSVHTSEYTFEPAPDVGPRAVRARLVVVSTGSSNCWIPGWPPPGSSTSRWEGTFEWPNGFPAVRWESTAHTSHTTDSYTPLEEGLNTMTFRRTTTYRALWEGRLEWEVPPPPQEGYSLTKVTLSMGPVVFAFGDPSGNPWEVPQLPFLSFFSVLPSLWGSYQRFPPSQTSGTTPWGFAFLRTESGCMKAPGIVGGWTYLYWDGVQAGNLKPGDRVTLRWDPTQFPPCEAHAEESFAGPVGLWGGVILENV